MGWGLRVWGLGLMVFGLSVWGWGLRCLVWGCGLGVYILYKTFRALAKSQDFCEETFLATNSFFRKKLRYVQQNLFVNKSHTFYQTKSKVFAKH